MRSAVARHNSDVLVHISLIYNPYSIVNETNDREDRRCAQCAALLMLSADIRVSCGKE